MEKTKQELEFVINSKIDEQPKPVEIDKTILYLFDNDVLRGIYYPFFSLVRQYSAMNEKMVYLKPINKGVFVSKLKEFGKFSMDRATEFIKCIDEILEEGIKHLHRSQKTPLFNHNDIIIELCPNGVVKPPIELLSDEDFIKLCFLISRKLILDEYFTILVECCSKIIINIRHGLEYRLGYIELLQHDKIMPQIADLMASVIDESKMKKTTRRTSEQSYELKRRNFILTYLPQSIKVTKEKIDCIVQPNRLNFNHAVYLRYKQSCLK